MQPALLALRAWAHVALKPCHVSACSCHNSSHHPQVVWSPRLQPAPLAMRAWACAVVLSASAGLWLLYLITTGAQHLANGCTQQTDLACIDSIFDESV